MINTQNRIRLTQFGKRLTNLSSKLTVGTSTLTPLNYSDEREKFFSSDTYNPIFYYSKNDTSGLHKEVQSLLEELGEISLPNNLSYYFYNALQSLSTDIDLIDAIGADSFAEIAADVFQYDTIDSNSLLQQSANISFNEPRNCKLQCAEEMSKNFTKYIEDLGIDYSVTIDHFNDHIIRVGAKNLVIGAAVKRYCNNVERLIVHEVESHILQRHNLKNAHNPLLRIIPRSHLSLWGEGLAVYNEISSGIITRSAFETYYYRLRAVEKLEYSFREIFENLAQYVNPEKAFMITYRVKRGMGDTSQPGGYGKDAAYLMGYRKVSEYIANGGSIEFLYLSKYPQIGELLLEHEMLEITPVLLPAYLKKQKTFSHQYTTPSSPLI